jgi:hypothetical protein
MFYLLYSLDDLNPPDESTSTPLHHSVDLSLDEGTELPIMRSNMRRVGRPSGDSAPSAHAPAGATPRPRFVDCPNCSGSLDTVTGICAHCGFTRESPEAKLLARAQLFSFLGITVCILSAPLVAITRIYQPSWALCLAGIALMLAGMFGRQKLSDQRAEEGLFPIQERCFVERYGGALLAVIVAAVIRMMLNPLLGINQPFFTFVIAILFIAWNYGLGPALLATLVSVQYANYYYIPPLYSFDVVSVSEGIRLSIMAVLGISVSIFCDVHRRRYVRWLSQRSPGLPESE